MNPAKRSDLAAPQIYPTDATRHLRGKINGLATDTGLGSGRVVNFYGLQMGC